MRPIGWVLQSVTPLLLLAVVVVGAGPAGSVFHINGGLLAATRPCPPASGFVAAVSSSARRAAIDAQLKLATSLGSSGEVSGRVLAVSTSAGSRSIALATESFAAAPVANVVVFGQADAAGSRVRAVDLETGCEFSLYSTTDAVRSAVIDAGLDALYVHAVSAADRSDRGVRRVDLATGASRVVVQPLAASSAFGITFATLLRWSLEADALAVQSCGFAACRTRVLSLGSGAVATYSDTGQGEIIGLDRAKVFAFQPCHDRPCALQSIDRKTGQVETIEVDAYAASVAEVGGATVLSVDTPAGTKEIRP